MSTVKAESADIPRKPPDKLRVTERLLAIPLVNLAVSLVVTLYGIVKRKSPFLESVLNRGERVFSVVVKRVWIYASNLKLRRDVLTLATISSTAVKLVKKNVASAKMSSRKLMRQGRRRMVQYVRNKTGYMLRSFPGRLAMWTVDRVCGVLETALYLVRPDLNMVKQNLSPKPNGSTKHILNELSENLEKRREHGLMFRVLVIITKPFELMVCAVQFVHQQLHEIADDKKDHSKENGCLSPEKMSEIQSRRKVSPRKKVRGGFLNQLQRTFNSIGLTRYLPGITRKFDIDISGYDRAQLNTSPNKAEDDEKKRKYDDILSESETDSEEEEDLTNMDLENYVSDEDPDFKPLDKGEGDSTDSEEYKEGDTESDIEFETSIGGTQQVKVKPDPAKVVNSSRSKEQNENSKPIDAPRAKDQLKTTPLKSSQQSVLSPKSNAKSNTIKCSTPKNSGKENAPPPESKALVTAGSKKATDPKLGAIENGDKKQDSKNSQMANGDPKQEAKCVSNSGKKGSNGDKK